MVETPATFGFGAWRLRFPPTNPFPPPPSPTKSGEHACGGRLAGLPRTKNGEQHDGQKVALKVDVMTTQMLFHHCSYVLMCGCLVIPQMFCCMVEMATSAKGAHDVILCLKLPTMATQMLHHRSSSVLACGLLVIPQLFCCLVKTTIGTEGFCTTSRHSQEDAARSSCHSIRAEGHTLRRLHEQDLGLGVQRCNKRIGKICSGSH